MTIEEKVAHRIRELCKEHGLSVCQLAKRSGMSPTTIYRILKADGTCQTQMHSIFKICRGFGITLREFFASELLNR